MAQAQAPKKTTGGNSFKDTYQAESTFTGGFKYPEEILIVGLDIPIAGWNEDLWDQERLVYAQAHPIDPNGLIRITEAGGTIPAVEVVKRQGQILAVEGRRRILGTRAANKILAGKGAKPADLIELAFIPAKGEDLEISVRIGNEGRLDDPPWIKAKNAGRMRRRGKSIDVIRTAFGGVEKITVDNWFHYLKVAPSIQALVEDESTKGRDQRIPFAIAIELGKMGKDDDPNHAGQVAVLTKAREIDAGLTGERGRDNVKVLIKAYAEGKLDQIGKAEPSPAQIPAQIPAQVVDHTGPSGITANPAPQVVTTQCGKDGKCTFHASGGKTTDRCSGTPVKAQPRTRGGATGQRNEIRITGQRLSPGAVREIQARLEPTEHEPFTPGKDDAIRAVFAAIRVITGDDPSAEGLVDFPEIQKAFAPMVRSPNVNGAAK